MTKPDCTVASAAAVLCHDNRALTLLHTYYDDARQSGLAPHHAINKALGKLSEFPKPNPGRKADEQ